jgi:hypothetical protein
MQVQKQIVTFYEWRAMSRIRRTLHWLLSALEPACRQGVNFRLPLTTKRILLDALGWGLAATTSEFGRVGVEYGRILAQRPNSGCRL